MTTRELRNLIMKWQGSEIGARFDCVNEIVTEYESDNLTIKQIFTIAFECPDKSPRWESVLPHSVRRMHQEFVCEFANMVRGLLHDEVNALMHEGEDDEE
jgi:hypothetical protein